PAWQNDLAAAYMNRGNARSGQGDSEGAIADYHQAISLRMGRAQRLEPVGQWPPAWQNDLAAAYINRGNARSGQGDSDGAIADYDQAISLRESLRQRLEPVGQWPPAWQNDLAAAYMNRGNARSGQGDSEGVIADYHQAISL